MKVPLSGSGQAVGPLPRLWLIFIPTPFACSEGYVVAAGDVYHEYETGPLKYDDPGTVRGNALKVRRMPSVDLRFAD